MVLYLGLYQKVHIWHSGLGHGSVPEDGWRSFRYDELPSISGNIRRARVSAVR